jgi:hypothetical protein
MKIPAFGFIFLCSLLWTPSFHHTGSARAEVAPGDTITKDNLTQAEAFLTPATRWMVEQGMTIQVIETKRVEWPKAYKEATEKYAAQVKISEDGRDITNYIAGCPFPAIDVNDPLAGFKVMWNHEQSPAVIDNAGTTFVAEVVNSKGSSDRSYEMAWKRLMWNGRLYTDPKPVIAHTPPTRHSNLFGPIFMPQDLKGLALLFFHYIPRDTPDDTYVYAPEMRKVRRISFANRSDALGGSDFDVDSMFGFNGSIAHWTFRVIAEREILAIVHSGKYGDPSQWCAPRDGKHGILSALPCVSWEKRKVFVVEGTPTAYPRDYAYSKRVLYMDREFFGPIVHEMYDQNNELWKGMVPAIFYTKKPYEGYPKNPISGAKYNYEDEQSFVPNWTLVDIKNIQATIGEAPPSNKKPNEWRNEWYFNEDISNNEPTTYSTSALGQGGR